MGGQAVLPSEAVASYSGSNIQNILERAKRFETEVLEKLRKQTNAVLFDKEFDDSLEFDVSCRQVEAVPVVGGGSSEMDIGRQQVTAPPLSSGSLTPNDSLSTGRLLIFFQTNPVAQSRCGVVLTRLVSTRIIL